MDKNQVLRLRLLKTLVLRRTPFLSYLATLALVACTADTTGPYAVPNVRTYLTERAQQFIDSRGAFFLNVPPLDTQYPIIDSVMAGALADAFLPIAESVPGIWMFVEEQHGGALHVANMKRVARVEFMQTPYEPVPDTIAEWIRRAEGPYYVFRYLEKGTSAVTASVSAYSTHLSIVNGHIVFPIQFGEEFYVDGMHPGNYERPLGPEEAVQVAAKETGAKVDAVPTLLRTRFHYGKLFAKWKITLDRVVPVQGLETGTQYSTKILYVGHSLTKAKKDAFFVALPEQPTEELDFRVPLMLKVRKGFPVAFEEVLVSK